MYVRIHSYIFTIIIINRVQHTVILDIEWQPEQE